MPQNSIVAVNLKFVEVTIVEGPLSTSQIIPIEDINLNLRVSDATEVTELEIFIKGESIITLGDSAELAPLSDNFSILGNRYPDVSISSLYNGWKSFIID